MTAAMIDPTVCPAYRVPAVFLVVETDDETVTLVDCCLYGQETLESCIIYARPDRKLAEGDMVLGHFGDDFETADTPTLHVGGFIARQAKHYVNVEGTRWQAGWHPMNAEGELLHPDDKDNFPGDPFAKNLGALYAAVQAMETFDID